MQNTHLKDRYDIIIVGAGISGQSCAKTLADADFSVLLIDTNPHFYQKVCAGGITSKDIPLISGKYVYRNLQPVIISHNKSRYITKQNVIASFDRERFLSDGMAELRGKKNIEVSIPSHLKEVTNQQSIILNDNREIRYTFLVGADGSNSKIRHHLGLPRNNIAIGMQFITQGTIDRPFELILDDDTAGYLWIFPHGDCAKVGIGGFLKSNRPEELKQRLESFIEKISIKIQPTSFQSSIILTDYRGYSFGNTYLVGDAAGFTPALSWEGIYPAIISGTVVGEEILGEASPTVAKAKLQKHLRKKKIMDGFSQLLTRKSTRTYLFKLGIKALNVPFMEKAVTRVIL